MINGLSGDIEKSSLLWKLLELHGLEEKAVSSNLTLSHS